MFQGLWKCAGTSCCRLKVKTAAEEAEIALRRLRIQHRVEDRPDQQDAEGIQKAHSREQHNRCKRLQRIAAHIEQQPSDTSKPAHRCISES